MSSKDSTEAGCEGSGWAVAADRFGRSCYTPKCAVGEYEIFDILGMSLPLEEVVVSV